jgi:hypothetical protein
MALMFVKLTSNSAYSWNQILNSKAYTGLGLKHNHILEAAAKKSVAEKESVLGTTAYDKMNIPLKTWQQTKYQLLEANHVFTRYKNQ